MGKPAEVFTFYSVCSQIQCIVVYLGINVQMSHSLPHTKKNELALRSLIVFEPTIRGKFFESRLALEPNFASQPDGHKDVFDLCLPYHSGTELFSAFCENLLGIEYLSTKTKKKPTSPDEKGELIFNQPFHCASAYNGISIEVKTTTGNSFKIKQTEGHLIQPEKSQDGKVISHALDIEYRHADFYLLVQLNEPNKNTTIDNIFSLIRDTWVVSTFRLENYILPNVEKSIVSTADLNISREMLEQSTMSSDKATKNHAKYLNFFNHLRENGRLSEYLRKPPRLANYLRIMVEREIQEYGAEIANHKKDLDLRKFAAGRKKATKSTLPD